MEFREVKDEQRQQPVTPKKRRKPKPPQANGGSSSSAVVSSSLSRTPSSSPTGDDGDGKGGDQQQQDHEQGGGGRRTRLVWTTELHKLFVEAYDSLGDDAVPRKILEKMNEKINITEVSREQIASHLQKHKINMRQQAKVPSSHSPTEEAPASHSLRSLHPNTTPLAEEVSHQAQLELVQVLQEQPDCLSRRNRSSIATNLHTVQSIQQLFGPPIKEGEARPGETMQRAPAHLGCSAVEGHGWNLENKGCTGQHMETSIADSEEEDSVDDRGVAAAMLGKATECSVGCKGDDDSEDGGAATKLGEAVQVDESQGGFNDELPPEEDEAAVQVDVSQGGFNDELLPEEDEAAQALLHLASTPTFFSPPDH